MDQLINSEQTPVIRPVRDLRNNYSEIAKIIEKHNPVFITNNGRGTAVLINIEDYADYEKYLYEKYALKMLDEAEQYATAEAAEWYDFDNVQNEKREKLIAMLQNKNPAKRG